MNEKKTRELTEDELDIEGESTRLWFYLGACMAMDGPRARETAVEIWKLTPFVRALTSLALDNPGRTRQLWAAELCREMPFTRQPLGMPRVEIEEKTEEEP